MTLAFASLGSGSKGNGTLIRNSESLILVDCGFTVKETEKRLERLGVAPDDVDAILVTHEHGDHINGVGPLARKYQLPVHITPGTLRNTKKSAKIDALPNWQAIHGYAAFTIKSLSVTPVAVPHDASEPAQFIIESGGKRLGILTDLGNVSPHVEQHYQACDALILEANHDPMMLASGPYPQSIKQRVGGAWGHLSNQQAANFLQSVDHNKLQHLVVAHISRQNNTLALAQQALASVEGSLNNVVYACQDEGFDWISLTA